MARFQSCLAGAFAEEDYWNTYTAPNLSYTYDRSGALETATDNTASQTLVSATSYGPANELLSITGASGGWYGETRTYNSIKQLTSLSSSGVNIAYNYPSSNNNGKIGSQTDSVSGETLTYTYDALNRLARAQNQTGFSPLWGQSFSYDGFSNLTGTSVTQGSAPTLSASYDVNNHAGGEDANGNPGSIYLPADGSSYAATYDVENRLRSTGSSTIFYSYAPGNRRVWQGTGSWTATYGTCNPTPGSTEEITFWGVNGQKLMSYNLTEGFVGSQCHFTATAIGTNYYFGNRLIKNTGGYVYPDRLGSIGKFYPYGIERPSATTNGTEKFTGYLRDAESGNDYAINRYMSPGNGRFITPDPTQGSFANPADPGSWNLYAYTKGDPVNRVDRGGTDPSDIADSSDCVGDYCFLMFSDEEDTSSLGAFCLSIAGSFGGNGDAFSDCNQVISDCNTGQDSGVLDPGEEAADCQTADLAGLATPPPSNFLDATTLPLPVPTTPSIVDVIGLPCVAFPVLCGIAAPVLVGVAIGVNIGVPIEVPRKHSNDIGGSKRVKADRDAECEKQYLADIAECKIRFPYSSNKRVRASYIACAGHASMRYARCLQGEPFPPLQPGGVGLKED